MAKKLITILEQLIQDGIRFGVVESVVKCKGVNGHYGKDIHAVILADQRKKMTAFKQRFSISEHSATVLKCEFFPYDLEWFERNLNKFDKVIHTEHGRVYELKGMETLVGTFKKY